MPIYEEKLICPLAIRFTQEHIRPVFQGGLDLETSIKEIKTRPATGDYDLILEAPFPNIEIVRWFQCSEDRVEKDANHWFTLDNRRLYCLQRLAAAHWPLRVAAVVEVLYNATDGIHRKDDSSTVGRSVGIGHSLKALTGRWDWRASIPLGSVGAEAPEEVVKNDDKRSSCVALLDAPAAPTMLERFIQKGTCEPEVVSAKRASSGSTRPPSPRSSPDSDFSCSTPPHQTAEMIWKTLAANLSGKWQGEQEEIYYILAGTDPYYLTWNCTRDDGYGPAKEFQLWYDEPKGAVWWGDGCHLYLDASDICKTAGYAYWYSGNYNGKHKKPRFSWERLGPVEPIVEEAPAAAAGKQRNNKAQTNKQYSEKKQQSSRKPQQKQQWAPVGVC